MLTGLPCSKPISRYSGSAGASSGFLLRMNMSFGGSFHGSSRMPPSKERCSRLRSMEYGFSAVAVIGILCFFAYSMQSVRLLRSHSRQGAITCTSGSKNMAPSSKRT